MAAVPYRRTFQRLLGFLRPYKRGLTASWVLASAAMVMSVALPYLTGRAVDALRRGAFHTQRDQLLLRKIDFVEHFRHQVALLDADAVLAGEHAADLDAQLENVGAEFFGALKLARFVGVV